MSDRLTKVSIDSVLYDLGSRGINSYETLADMVAEEIGNLYDGCIAYCVEDEKYYQWKSTNEVTTYARWRVLEFGSKSQVAEMPVPNEDLNGSIIQYIGETNATYKKGWFYTCVFANNGFAQTVCTADTRGDFYLKETDGSYTLVQLDGTNFDSSATYYQKVNAVSRWDEISTQSTDNKVDKIEGKGLSTNDFTDELKENYDNASDKAHEHENKTVLDTITEQNVMDWKDASEKAHSHENKEVLDKFTESDKGEVLYKGKQIAGGNLWNGTKEEFDAIEDKDPDTTYVITDDKDDEVSLSDLVIDDSSTTSEKKSWSVKKINDTVVLKNTGVLHKNAPTSAGMTTFTLDISSLGLTHGIYHFKCYVVGGGNVVHCAEGSIGQYDGSYYISIDYKSSYISSIVINGTTITVTTSAAHYNLGFSIQSIYDWEES